MKKTKVMETATNEDENVAVENYAFQKTQCFMNLGAAITGNND